MPKYKQGHAYIYSADGTVSAPSRTFASDTDTGRYLVAANSMADVAGGVEFLRFTNAAQDILFVNQPGTADIDVSFLASSSVQGFFQEGSSGRAAIGMTAPA